MPVTTAAQQTKRKRGDVAGCCLDYIQASARSGKGVARATETLAQLHMQFGVLEVCRNMHPTATGAQPKQYYDCLLPWIVSRKSAT